MSTHHSATHDDHVDDGAVHSHIAPVKFYLAVFAALIFFTLLTVGLSYVHLGSANLAIAILIASMKAILVVLFFMHLKYDNKFIGSVFICGLLFIGVFFAYTMNDTEFRGHELSDVNGKKVYLGPQGGEAPGGFVAPKEATHAEHLVGAEGKAAEHGAPAAGH